MIVATVLVGSYSKVHFYDSCGPPAKLELVMRKQMSQAFRFTLLMTVLTGLVYPGVVTGLCQLLFPRTANGSLLKINGRVVGSTLLGQNFSSPEYFHPRPSAAGNDGYDATASSGSNLGPTNQKLIDRVKADVAKFRMENPNYQGPIPADMVTTSASGLDPDISLASAFAQAPRVAQARRTTVDQVNQLIQAEARGRRWGFLGEPRVNVLQLNVALNQRFPMVPKKQS